MSGNLRREPSSWSGRLEQILLNEAGWSARKNPAVGEVFFLTSPFIELIGTNRRTSLARTQAPVKIRKNPLDFLSRWDHKDCTVMSQPGG